MDAPTVEAALAAIPFLRAMATSAPSAMSSVRSRIILAGTPIWARGDEAGQFIFLVEGRVKLVGAAEDGREIMIDILGPGSLLCAAAPWSGRPCCCAAEAMEPNAVITTIARPVVMASLARDAPVAMALLSVALGRSQCLCTRVLELGAGRVEQRIASLMLRLADRTGKPRDGGIFVPVPLARRDLADLLGTTVETTIRVMRRFDADRLLLTRGGGFMIPNRVALEAVAGGAGRGRQRGQHT